MQRIKVLDDLGFTNTMLLCMVFFGGISLWIGGGVYALKIVAILVVSMIGGWIIGRMSAA